ncbi:MAG: hypothetical protein QW228_02050 [Candidatus Aenigmatarchaeota archaeon]
MEGEIKKRVDEALSRIKNIKFFQQARSLEEANSLVLEVDKIIECYLDTLKPWKKKNETWNLAEYEALRSADHASRRVALIEVFVRMWNEAWDLARCEAYKATCIATGCASSELAACAATDVAVHAANYAAWETVKGLPGFEKNPYDYVMKLYEMGLKPKGFKKVNGEERYVVDFPLSMDVLGCYAHGDGEILWTHEWKDDCKNLRYIKPTKRVPSRIIE